MLIHGNARLLPRQRVLMCERVRHEGWTVSEAAEAFGVSTRTVFRWLRRFDAGDPMTDRSSVPHDVPGRTPAEIEALIATTFSKKQMLTLGPSRAKGDAPLVRVVEHHAVQRLDAHAQSSTHDVRGPRPKGANPQPFQCSLQNSGRRCGGSVAFERCRRTLKVAGGPRALLPRVVLGCPSRHCPRPARRRTPAPGLVRRRRHGGDRALLRRAVPDSAALSPSRAPLSW